MEADQPTTPEQEAAHTDLSAGVWESNFRERMLHIREFQGMTQTDLARVLKNNYGLPFHQQTIQRIESGERPIRLNEANLIAETLNVELFEMTADMGTPKAVGIQLKIARDRLADRVREIAAYVSEKMDEVEDIYLGTHSVWETYEDAQRGEPADRDLAADMRQFESRYERVQTAGRAIMELGDF